MLVLFQKLLRLTTSLPLIRVASFKTTTSLAVWLILVTILHVLSICKDTLRLFKSLLHLTLGRLQDRLLLVLELNSLALSLYLHSLTFPFLLRCRGICRKVNYAYSYNL